MTRFIDDTQAPDCGADCVGAKASVGFHMDRTAETVALHCGPYHGGRPLSERPKVKPAPAANIRRAASSAATG